MNSTLSTLDEPALRGLLARQVVNFLEIRRSPKGQIRLDQTNAIRAAIARTISRITPTSFDDAACANTSSLKGLDQETLEIILVARVRAYLASDTQPPLTAVVVVATILERRQHQSQNALQHAAYPGPAAKKKYRPFNSGETVPAFAQAAFAV